jgi:6-phosphogluconolactonase
MPTIPLKSIHWDSRRDIIILSERDFVPYIVETFYALFKKAPETFSVALSGGSTPKEVFTAIAKHPEAKTADWKKLHLFWGDERAVPPDHPDSNYRMAMEAGFGTLPIPQEHIHRMVVETNIKENALLYEEELKPFKEGLDLIFLGMGDDGHTASLFPKTSGIQERKRYVIENYVDTKHCHRTTMTFPFINKCKNIMILVKGASKGSMLNEVFSSKGSRYPAFHVGTAQHRALWIVDEPAAQLLSTVDRTHHL